MSEIVILPDGCQSPGEGQGLEWMSLMTGRQCLAARIGLGWTQSDLAGRASVSRGTIAALEDGKGTVLANNRTAVIAAFLAAGVTFTSDDTTESVSFLKEVPSD